MRREPITYGTISKQLQIQQGIRDWLNDIPFNFFVTANFNCSTSEQSARSALRRWHGMIDRQLLGPKWHRKPADQRTMFFAFAEHPNSNRHFHLMLKTDQPIAFAEIADRMWNKIVPAGSMDVQFFDQQQDRLNTICYSTKEIWKHDLINSFIISSEFSSHT